MRKTVLGTLMAAMVCAAMATPTSAEAQAPTRAALRAEDGVTFAYDAAQINEEGDHVSWRWTMTNNSDAPVSQVVLTHQISPWLPPTRLTGPCEVVGESVKCRWQTLQPGEQAEGNIEADLPDDLNGSVQINGRITWQSSNAATSTTPLP
ncbi:hypothetical protein [Streptomyces sp. NPDC051561]|uniref:hypothetical protein n=1 Tax=Streptomyces sp. NPDC051561 TaxID=3365658 RepID=UPI0037B3B32B